MIPPLGKTSLRDRSRLTDAIDRLIELYTATNQPDQAEKWRAERRNYPDVAPPPRPAR